MVDNVFHCAFIIALHISCCQIQWCCLKERDKRNIITNLLNTTKQISGVVNADVNQDPYMLYTNKCMSITPCVNMYSMAKCSNNRAMHDSMSCWVFGSRRMPGSERWTICKEDNRSIQLMSGVYQLYDSMI